MKNTKEDIIKYIEENVNYKYYTPACKDAMIALAMAYLAVSKNEQLSSENIRQLIIRGFDDATNLINQIYHDTISYKNNTIDREILKLNDKKILNSLSSNIKECIERVGNKKFLEGWDSAFNPISV